MLLLDAKVFTSSCTHTPIEAFTLYHDPFNTDAFRHGHTQSKQILTLWPEACHDLTSTKTHTLTHTHTNLHVYTHTQRRKAWAATESHPERASESLCLATGHRDNSIFLLSLSGRMGMQLENVVYVFPVILHNRFISNRFFFFCFLSTICHNLNVTFDWLSIEQMIWWLIRALLLNVAVVRLMFWTFLWMGM